MKLVFADTSFFIALSSTRDEHYENAHAFADGYRGQIVTTDFVLVEVANHYSRANEHYLFTSLMQSLNQWRRIIIPASRDLFQDGVQLFEQRPDKDWSLTDCMSMIVMNQHSITEAVTNDHHFEQVGYTILLK